MSHVKKIGLIFPHQLFGYSEHPLLQQDIDELWVIEDSLFFGDKHTKIYFHHNKLVLHRASMKSFINNLPKSWRAKTVYISYNQNQTITDIVKPHAKNSFLVVDPVDYLLAKRLQRVCENITVLPTVNFIASDDQNSKYVSQHKNLRQEYYYRWLRKSTNTLMNDGEPVGGKWNFDHDNRKKIPKKNIDFIPEDPPANTCSEVIEAKKYVDSLSVKTYGTSDCLFWYPVNHEDALAWLDSFLQERFHLFGDYEDALLSDRHVLYHSSLSALINSGLLNPKKVIDAAIAYANAHNVPVNALEGFVRQILGWREYMRVTYQNQGTAMRTANQWGHTKKLASCWWNGTTGLDPVDDVIKKTLKTGYAHHIERLMVIGNVMFMCGIDPKQVYDWFMSLYIDAYDWVMVPNIYAMSQFTQDSIITTKPYISGSNYINKMGHYAKGDWCKQWDALYWNFLITHYNTLKQNHRMNMILSRATTMTDEQKQQYKKQAQATIARITTN